jgi:hypothetical protein
MLIRMEGWHLVAQAPRDHLVNRGGMLAGTPVALPERWRFMQQVQLCYHVD